MKKLTLTALALLVMTTTALTFRGVNASQISTADSNNATKAAYRDGLFVGKLAATSGNPREVSTGRWISKEDRASYETGYQKAYGDVIASRNTR